MVLLVLAGCTRGGDLVRGRAVRDSAGVRVVENARPTSTLEISAGDTLLTVGGEELEPGQELHRVVAAFRLTDGVLVIANAGTGELRRYSASGSYLGATGGLGDGPGEFRSLAWAGRLPGDSIIAWDARSRRISLFGPFGEHVRDWWPMVPDDPPSLVVHGVLESGRLLMSRGASFDPSTEEAGVQRQPLALWVIGPAGIMEREVGTWPGEAVDLRNGRDAGSMIRTPVPFGAATLFASGSGHLFVADNQRWDVLVFDSEGALVERVRRPLEPVPVTPSDVHAAIEERLRPLPPVAEIRAGMRAALEVVPVPATMPAIAALHADSEGMLWVEAGSATGAVQSIWSVFDADGEWVTDAALPSAWNVLDIGPDYLIVIERTELDIEIVRVIRLKRSSV